MPLRLLTVQTATPAGSLAVTEDDRLLGEISLHVRQTQAGWLIPTIADLLERTELTVEDLDGFGVVIGPGSFTSLRVGLATVKGLALAVDRPIVPVSTLRTLAMQTPFSRLPVCAMLDARKKEVYAGLYDWATGQPHPIAAERVTRPETLFDDLPEETLFIGDGAVVYRTLITRRLGSRAHFAPACLNLPRAGSAAMLVLQEWAAGHRFTPQEVTPVYIRPSEAELNWRGGNEGG